MKIGGWVYVWFYDFIPTIQARVGYSETEITATPGVLGVYASRIVRISCTDLRNHEI